MDPGREKSKSGINIPDPQHCLCEYDLREYGLRENGLLAYGQLILTVTEK